MEIKITTLIEDGNHERALSLMTDAYAKQIGRFCTGLVGSPSEAEDLLQETFIQAWTALPHYRAESSVRAWLYGIARKVCASHLRKRDRRSTLLRRFFSGGGEEDTTTGEGADRVARSETRTIINRALMRLKPKLREAVLLQYQAEMQTSEIAEILGISPANARKRVSLGIGELRELLRPVLMEPTKDDKGACENENEESVQAYSGPRLVKPREGD
ncbi:RNA polymerase sigma factor [Myxococcota bacterium]|nr:RNA polymerase sigma factor [Myxococcota bacterium]MBU1535312.1 RNA polymerase sigma factor [Myxococcota bacterium]